MFCTLICCMDGRFIHIINEYIRANYRYEFVDTITDAGPANKIVNETEKDNFAVNVFVFTGCIGEMVADIAQTGCTEQCIA